MVRRLVLLVGAALAQDHRPWNRLGERLGLPADSPVPKSVADAIATAKQLLTPKAPNPSNTDTTTTPGPVGGARDANGCVPGGGYTWCDAKKKCLREWEEPCKAADPVCAADEVICTADMQAQGMNCVVGACFKAPAPVPVCTTGQVACSAAMQAQGMNCVLGTCVKSPGSLSAMTGRTDPNGCPLGSGYTWCAPKNKCLRKWEEACEESASNVPVCSTGEIVCTAAMQQQGMNCVLNTCIKAPSPVCVTGETLCTALLQKQGMNCIVGKCFRPPSSNIQPFAAVGGSRDNHGCVSGGGYQWCEAKQKCLRQWEEACEQVETTSEPKTLPVPVQPEQPATEPTQNSPSKLMQSVLAQIPEDQKAQVSKLMADLKDKKSQYVGALKQKMDQLKNKDAIGKISNAVRDRMDQLAAALGKPTLARQPEKIGAYEDHRTSGPVTDKPDAVTNGVF